MARQKMIRVHEHELNELKEYRSENYNDEPALGLVITDLVRGDSDD